MNPILIIIGSPASGKSTISQEIAKQSLKGVHIPVDDLRIMVLGGVIHPGPEWHPELVEQLELARQTAIDMALRYQSSGFLVAIDDFWDPYSQLKEYEPLIDNPNVIKIILKPDVNTTIARNHARMPPSEFRTQMDDAIRMVNLELDKQGSTLRTRGWHIIDTTNDTIEETISRILSLIETPID